MRVPAALAASTLCLLLAGCATVGDTADGAGPGDPAGPDAQRTALERDVTVYAAASLTEAFGEIGELFEAENPGVSVAVNFAGSAALAEGILSGAPVDVFAAANAATMATVSDASLLAGDATVFAGNTLEIAVPAGNPARVTGLADFADPARTIALCAPEVPCGAASEALFSAVGITPAPDTLEPDVRAALTKVELGEVDAALVYRTDVSAADGAVEGIAVAEAAGIVTEYPIARLTDAPHPASGDAFVEFVLSPQGQRVLENAGFQQG